MRKFFFLLVLAFALPGFGQTAVAYRPWIGPDGQPLPFRSDAEVLEFLRTAEVVSEKEISSGVTVPRKVLLEKDGIRANAVFRHIDLEDTAHRIDPMEMHFRDSYRFEPAAYELSVMVGLDIVPPTILRKVHGTSGSLQLWVEKAITELKRVNEHLAAPDPTWWTRQIHDLRVFDALIYNNDRHQQNLLITTDDWKLWSIDHTRTFRLREDLPDARQLTRCNRNFFRRLQALNEAELRARTRDMLRTAQVSAVMKRRDQIVRHFQRLIAERGEEAVLFDLRSPGGASQ